MNPSLRAWILTPAALGVHLPVSSSKTSAFPTVRLGRRLALTHTATSVWNPFRGCNHSFMFRPASLLATQVAPTTVMLHSPSVDSLTSSFLSVSRRVPQLVESWTYPLYTTEQPWRFLPNNSRFVTSPSPGYASRLNRVIDDRGFSPHKIHSLVGCPLTACASRAGLTRSSTSAYT